MLIEPHRQPLKVQKWRFARISLAGAEAHGPRYGIAHPAGFAKRRHHLKFPAASERAGIGQHLHVIPAQGKLVFAQVGEVVGFLAQQPLV